ncbi:MAG TPA: aspartate/glutamate racemase family protein [Rhizobium sp.]
MRRLLNGHTIHGASVGILMLDTAFERLPGDIGNAGTWDFPVLYKVVKNATQDRVFGGDLNGLLAPFVEGCEELSALGADGIVTSCGFLAPLQLRLAEKSPVPVACSALMQVPMVQSLIGPAKRVGVITIDGASLTEAHFLGAVPMERICIAGMPSDGVMRRDLRGNARAVNPQAQAQELCEVGRSLVASHPDIGAIVVECTNLAPHSKALQRATGLPVFDMVTLVNWFQQALRPRSWAAN